MTAHLEQSRFGEFSAFTLSNDALRLVVVPEIGGKIVSLQSCTGREWLWQNPHFPLRRPPSDASDFGPYDCGGWDEIFPTVSPCQLPDSPWGDRMLVDHGELWYRPWSVVSAECTAERGATLSLAVDDPQLPFRFERTLTLGNGPAPLVVNYQLERRCNAPLPYLWAAHPILSVNPGDRIQLMPGLPVESTASVGIELAPEAVPFAWPTAQLIDGTTVDFSQVAPRSARTAIKLFAANQANNRIEIVDSTREERLSIVFDPAEVSHTGLWLNYGAWSGTNTEPCFNAVIEPTTAPHDSLLDAVVRNQAGTLSATTRTWQLQLSVQAASAR
jgi:galactose mutarotase-like enzyme